MARHQMAANGWKGAKAWRKRANEIAPTIVGGSKKHGGPALGPTRASGCLHAYPHADSALLQVSIEFLCLSLTVVQFLFTTLTCLFHKKCNRLKARVVIYAYQHHVRLLPSEPMVVMQPKCTVEGADIVMQSNTYQYRVLWSAWEYYTEHFR